MLARSSSIYQLVTLHSNQDAIRHGIGYVSEDRMSRGLVMAQSIEDNIISTVFHKVKDRFGFLSEAKVRDLVDRLIKALTIKVSDPHLPVNTLSGVTRSSIDRQMAGDWATTVDSR